LHFLEQLISRERNCPKTARNLLAATEKEAPDRGRNAHDKAQALRTPDKKNEL
jgi:hypothetical protein